MSSKIEKELKSTIKSTLSTHPPLMEFAGWLHKNEYYDDETIEVLLCKPWDGAYPTTILSDDILKDIDSFLYHVAKFAVEKVYGENYNSGRILIRIVAEPDYEDRSYVFVLELRTKTVLAGGCGGKTWNFDPDVLEEDLEDLIRQLEMSKTLLAARTVVEG